MSSTREQFAFALHRTARIWKAALDRRLKHLGLSQTGWLAIGFTARASAPQSQSDLAQELGIEGASVVAMVDKLVQGGWVLRQPSEVDRRVKHIVLTPAGHNLYAQLKAEAASFRNEILAQEDEAQLQQTTALLERVQALLEELP